MQATCDALHDHVVRLGESRVTLGAVLEAARSIHDAIPDAQPSGQDVRLSFHSIPRADPRHTCVELVWHWPRPEQLDAPPGRLWLRFDVHADDPAREVEVRCRDYPGVAEFVDAALHAATLDRGAIVSDLHVELESEHMS